jgi:hypothetical protein
MINYSDAIEAINPSAAFTCNEDEGIIDWLDGTTPISMEDIEAKRTELQVAYDAQDYSRNRKAEYDQLNQFELISDDSINGTTTHKDAILAIKAKYPKE